jgi:hypothetical protein
MKIKIHTYPDGPAVGLPKDEIVSAMGLRGRFSDARIGQLECGDQYIMPIQNELEPRSDTQLLALMAQKHLRALYIDNLIDPKSKTIMIVNSEGDQEICTVDYVMAECSDLDALRDALNYILDQEEL